MPPPSDEQAEYERLVAAWDSAGRTARTRFLKRIDYEASLAAADNEVVNEPRTN
jgi:hypothetical protein